MSDYNSLYEALASNSDSQRVIGYVRGGGDVKAVTYADLHQRALGILKHLQTLGLKKGSRLIIFLNNNEQFIDVLWACICGGIVPVPIAVGISDEHKFKLFRIIRQLDTAFLCTDSTTQHRLEIFANDNNLAGAFADLASRIFLIDKVTDIAEPGEPDPSAADDECLIQYSSGSTSDPKGVVLTHANLLANIDGVATAAQLTAEDVSLSWMPLTHDLGLIALHLTHFLSNMNQYVMQTDLFIRRPVLWLQEASRIKATVLSSPNFGYKHCLKLFKPKKAGEIDLSSVRIIFNGAEPISVSLCEEFLSTLAPFGLRRSSMLPVYGLAEASVGVTMPQPGTEYRSIRVDRNALGVGDSTRRIETDSAASLNVVCVGKPIRHCELRIVDGSDKAVGDYVAGHIHIRGRNVTRGYFKNPEANALAFRPDGWLDTGDLGFVTEGNLYITGRAKELIFVNGQNYYPHDLEAIAQETGGLELGKVAITGYRHKGAQTDELLVFVLHRRSVNDFVPFANLIARGINEHAGVEVTHVIPVNRIPKTTSGKIQRGRLANAYGAGEFGEVVSQLEALRSEGHGHEDHALTELESRVKDICDSVLTSKHFGVDDNLFEIGTNSLELIQIHEQIEEEFPGQMDITEMFDFPTISAIAQRLERNSAEGGSL